MLSVEIRINGTLISAISARNRGPMDSVGTYRYEYQCVTFPYNNEGPPKIAHGKLIHKRSAGAEALVAKLCRAATKKNPKSLNHGSD